MQLLKRNIGGGHFLGYITDFPPLQTGVAQRHYNSVRHKRERLPPKQTKPGQILAYPQREWKKKRYQYLRFFLQPRAGAAHFDQDAEMHTISQIENPNLAGGGGGAAAENVAAQGWRMSDGFFGTITYSREFF